MIFFFILITYLLDIVLILKGEILSWSLVGVKGLKLVFVVVAGYSPVGYNPMSPCQRVSPSNVRSPLYAGSSGGLQANSPYMNSPEHAASLRLMASSPHTLKAQSHPVPYPQFSGTAQGAHNTARQPRCMYTHTHVSEL